MNWTLQHKHVSEQRGRCITPSHAEARLRVFILTVSEENMGCLVFSWMRVFEVTDEGVDGLRKQASRVRLKSSQEYVHYCMCISECTTQFIKALLTWCFHSLYIKSEYSSQMNNFEHLCVTIKHNKIDQREQTDDHSKK